MSKEDVKKTLDELKEGVEEANEVLEDADMETMIHDEEHYFWSYFMVLGCLVCILAASIIYFLVASMEEKNK